MLVSGLVAAIAPFGFGMVLALVGSIKLDLARKLAIDEARVGGLLSAIGLSVAPMMLAAGFLEAALGVRWSMVLGSLACGLSTLAIAWGRSYPAVFAGTMGMAGFGTLLSVVPYVMAPHVFFPDDPTAANLTINIFFGMGAFLLPLLASVLLRRVRLERFVTGLALFLLLPGVLAASSPLVGEVEATAGWGWLAVPMLWLTGLMFTLYWPLESCVAGWTTTYLKDAGTPERTGAQLLSLFWLAFLASRVAAILLLREAPGLEEELVLGLGVASTLVIATMARTRARGAAALLVVVAGAAFGPVFPMFGGILYKVIPAESLGPAYGVMFAVGACGGIVVPPVVGAYARRTSVRRALWLLVGSGVLLVALAALVVAGVGQ